MTAVMDRPTHRPRPARPDQAMAVVPDWIEHHAVIPDGFRAGDPFRLYAYQLRWFAAFYTVRGTAEQRDLRNPLKAPAFVFRRGLLFGPQGIGKNPTIAAHVCVEAVGPALFAGWAGNDDGYVCRVWGCGCGWEFPYQAGEPMGMPWASPLIQITAVSEDATANTYDALRPMIEQGPLGDVIPKTTEGFIRLPDLYGTNIDGKACRIDTVTASAQTLLGGRVTFAPQDQAEQFYDRNGMRKVAQTQWRGLAKMGGRAAVLANMWDPSENSVAQQIWKEAERDVYIQGTIPPLNLSFANKAERRRIYRIGYPPEVLRENGGHVDLDGIDAEAVSLMETDAAQADRFFGNRPVAGSGVAADPVTWDNLAEKPPREIAAGTYVGLGFDGSLSQDSTVLRACTRDGYAFSLPGWSWIRPVGQAMARWIEQHPGQEWKVPRAEVKAAVNHAFAFLRVGRMRPDAAYWRDEITTWQNDYGEDVVVPADTNSTRVMAPMFDRWLTAVAEGNHHHDGDPVVTDHVKAMHKGHPKNAVKDDDGRLPVIPVKGENRAKIDGGLADILARDAAMTMSDEPPAVEPYAISRPRR